MMRKEKSKKLREAVKPAIVQNFTMNAKIKFLPEMKSKNPSDWL